MNDTDPEAAELQAAIHRRMGGAARVRLALDMSLAVRELALARIRSLHPDFTEQEVMRAYCVEVLGVPWPNGPVETPSATAGEGVDPCSGGCGAT